MADSSYPVHLGESTRIDSRTAPDGDHRPVVVVGDATATNTLAVDSSGRPTVLVSGTVPVSGTVTVNGSLTSAGTVTNTPTAGGGTGINFVTTASTNVLVQKASIGNLTEMSAYNFTASPIYIKIFNKATAPVLGTDSPNVVIPVLAGAAFFTEFGAAGKKFSAGISVAVTANAALLDNTAVAAGALISGTYV